MLRDRLEEYPLASGVEVSTIDSFQGREADAVVISMVRFVSGFFQFFKVTSRKWITS
jgi:superfamily I DNA and/or RNA helicase